VRQDQHQKEKILTRWSQKKAKKHSKRRKTQEGREVVALSLSTRLFTKTKKETSDEVRKKDSGDWALWPKKRVSQRGGRQELLPGLEAEGRGEKRNPKQEKKLERGGGQRGRDWI